ncbi:hypothetical protein [Terricaulis silvestris]|uniref:Lipoprotein n=1 Tax=Terricaulis silvestris TaxID=2686094 RepID=A0A6I6MN16_9CAUL|nr:hypothetical protein [Terricaulis silvestris]QGZ96079.1 hypothetical protein DSM104635_02935 [Terricaulis silvestris]
MRIFKAISVSMFFALAACGQAAAPNDADAQTAGAATSATGEATADEKSAILAALNLSANAQGHVQNECGDMVTPQFIVADVGPGVGRAIAFVIGGGPSAAACYGDGPLVVLYRSTEGGWREIYQNRGGGIIILPTQHNGGNDFADGGPGFSFPVWEWNGTTYVNANRTVADSALGDARFIPN